ncbi:MAG: hydantoinase, partial [Planctomycetes bacterium]|nr:hydantoinase [Planctomycetota bacterium]
MSRARPEFWIDVGGTFTDCIMRAPDGSIRTHKLLSSGVYKGRAGPGSSRERIVDHRHCGAGAGFFDGHTIEVGGISRKVGRFVNDEGAFELAESLDIAPAADAPFEISSGEEAPITGIRRLLGLRLNDAIGPLSVRLGTTRGTNALLERRGAATALVTTAGFADVLRIGYQDRPALFELDIHKPVDLYQTVIEIDERVDHEGHVLTPLDGGRVREQLAPLLSAGITSLAVCLLNAYRNPDHERAIEWIARGLGFAHVSLSIDVSPLQRIVTRGDTTVVDAYITPIIRDYVDAIRAKIPQATIKLMTSAGGLVDARAFTGKDSILSGPAGGVVACARVSQAAGFDKAIGFDMGGTSTDVSRFDGEFERRYEMRLQDPGSRTGVRIVAPMLAIETVAAGGGSICRFDGVKPAVGPRSAGAEPGPACYGRGGPLCLTDVNVFLGRVRADHFAFALELSAVRDRLDALIDEIRAATG